MTAATDRLAEIEGRAEKVARLCAEMDDWLEGRRSWTNLGPIAPYTPDVIAVMDAQEVVKRAAAITALSASEAGK